MESTTHIYSSESSPDQISPCCLHFWIAILRFSPTPPGHILPPYGSEPLVLRNVYGEHSCPLPKGWVCCSDHSRPK